MLYVRRGQRNMCSLLRIIINLYYININPYYPIINYGSVRFCVFVYVTKRLYGSSWISV